MKRGNKCPRGRMLINLMSIMKLKHLIKSQMKSNPKSTRTKKQTPRSIAPRKGKWT